ncbi:hypothetical protein CASFOL_003753 [Castilleja foliolosa]|uniref:Methyl-CpG-binding domain-containing protein 9 n=1 Tax=Castilleja foliolosa TaxID=1961234 RepID=A0ABD3EIM0_9LAMI
MDAEFSKRIGSARMALPIDLNEAPMPSPREAAEDAILGTAGVSICTVCRKGVPVGRINERVTEEQRREFKCFRCLLKNGGAGSSSGGGGGGAGRFDINASPPREAEEGGDVVVVAGRDGNGGRIQASSSHRALYRQVNPVPEDIRHYLPRASSMATQSANPIFRNIDRGHGANQSAAPVELPPKSPNILYLQSLREYIAKRSGLLGEGWHVEFEFCKMRLKTSAAYISPNGIRFKSVEDVASHLGLPSSENNLFPIAWSGLKADPAKETAAFLTAQSCRKRQKLVGCSEKEHDNIENVRRQDDAHDAFPVQFQDFCLISSGKVDPRRSYHNRNQIWPIGYRSSWHDRITGSVFVCDVAEGGVCGPIFKIQRYPCTKQPIPVGSTILSMTKPASSKEDDKKDDVPSLEVVDDDSLSTIILLNEDSPPCLENCLSASMRDEEARNPQDNNSPNSDLEILHQSNAVSLNDIIGEFQVEGHSSSFAWEMVSHAFLNSFREAYKQKGAIKFFCCCDVSGMDNERQEIGDPLLRYCYIDSLISFPPLVRNENEFNMACQMLFPWLNQDRFGLDADFVQEILEQLPRAGACSEYKTLNDRKLKSALQTVGSGFLQAERKSSDSGVFKGARINLYGTEGALKRGPCPQGEPLNSRLPAYLIGDALQVWELAWRFMDVLELGQPFTLRELESELVSPWSDACLSDSRQKSEITGDACLDTSPAGVLYAKIVGSLLKLLVSELLSKVAVYICPGESKSRRGKKKDLDCLSALKRTKLDMLPVNGLTWHEIARRYILAVMCMDGNLDSTEIAIRESRRVFHCLCGDGGILCGSLTGIAALEGDAVILADATKVIFGSMKSKNEIITVCERESDDNGAAQTVEVNDGVVPEWAQVLEPVRKLPTNVGARIRRCINEALEKNPPEWAKRILEHSISKEVYKGNASGPTKRAVISVLGNLGKENPEEKVEKKEKVKIKTNMFDLVTKQCRVVLRKAAALDEDKVFCNLLAKIILIPNDNDDVGVLGYPAMVSRPLDFRTIDLRLAAGAYGGSHEAFADDVREVWRNIYTAYGDRSDLTDKLSKMFEDLYENEVLTLVQKITEISNINESSADAIKERDDLLVHVCNSSLPRAPWEEGICKVCGIDKDDDNVLLCDKCDSGHHRYCLNPPLLKIPEGNWYCPSCVTGQSITSSSAYYGSIAIRNRKKKNHGGFTAKFLEELARLAKLMEIKEYWEFTVEERMFFMKFLFDDALNSAIVRDHIEQSASRSTELQQKLRSLTSELKLLKFKEEMLNSSAVEKSKSDASPSLLAIESISRGKQPEKGSGSNISPLEIPSLSEQIDNNNNNSKQPNWPTPTSSQPENSSLVAPLSPKDNSILKADTVKNDISNIQASIMSIESELLNVSLRKDYLGRDSSGRVYWAFFCPGARPCIIACGDNSSKERCVEEFASVPGSEKWVYYESDDEIEKLIRWLRDDNVREKELRESISQLQINKLKDVGYTANHILHKVSVNHNGQKYSSSDYYSATKAMSSLKKQLGLFSNMRRCECLELLWASKEHCSSCHHSFPNIEELRQHVKENCKPKGPVSNKIQTVEDNNNISNVSKRKKSKNVASHVSTTEKHNNIGPSFADRYADCPFNLDEIMTRFVVPGSVKDTVNEIGLMSTDGVPTFLQNESTYLDDPALKLDPARVNEASSTKTPVDSRSDEPRVVLITKENKELSRLTENGERLNVERSKSGPTKEKCTVIQLSKTSIICESSLRPLVGRSLEILKSIKINLLDIDAALPEDALRTSRSNHEKRRVWRDFVKSAKSIYEMVQATIVLEDAIKSEHLRNDWWYWSSYSTAAKITTLSALALRVYSLDAAISYDKPLPSVATEVTEPNCAVDDEVVPQGTTSKNPKNPSSTPLKKTEPESAENPRTRSKSSKRKKM